MSLIDHLEPLLPGFDNEVVVQENPEYLTRQLVTYIGNKRALVGQIEAGILKVRQRLGGREISSLDLFSGTGLVSRLLKGHSSLVIANDLERYSATLNRCFLNNASDVDMRTLRGVVDTLNRRADAREPVEGFFQELYSPRDDSNILPGERVFYTSENARRLDFYAQSIAELDEPIRTLVLGPLLSRASMHANTSGVFKGFYKDKETGIGKFGGSAGDALKRILEPIRLEVPVLSSHHSDSVVYQRDANELVGELPELDLAYLDPPYNQHPYGSNYFMLNLIDRYERPTEVSAVSGIPTGWNRSGYNVRKKASSLLLDLVERTPARFLLISFNSEGFVDPEELNWSLSEHGVVEEMVVPYNTFRGSRNLRNRAIHVNEHLFLLERF